MERRRFFALTAGGLLAAAVPAHAQGTMRRIGILGNVPVTDPEGARLWGAFADGLRDLGYVDGRNVTIENLSSEGKYERLPALAADLVGHKVDVIVAPAAQNVEAAKRATRDIPIVMVSVGDPVGNGLVASLNHPGGNVTGTSFLTSALVGKQLELLKEIVPRASRLAILVNPTNPAHPLTLEEAKAAVRALGVQLQTVQAKGPEGFESAFAAMTREHAGALFVPWDGMFLLHLARLTQLAARWHLPALYGQRSFVDAGGLASYAPSASESFRRAASYVDKIFKGAKPGDLPVEQPTKFELVVNLKTARALGLTTSPRLLERADQVIE